MKVQNPREPRPNIIGGSVSRSFSDKYFLGRVSAMLWVGGSIGYDFSYIRCSKCRRKAHCEINCRVICFLQWVKIVCFKKDTIPTTLFQTICSDFWVCIGCILMITAFDIFQQTAKLYLNIWKVIGTCVCSVFLKHRGTLLALLLIRFWVTVEKCLEVGEMLKSVQKKEKSCFSYEKT